MKYLLTILCLLLPSVASAQCPGGQCGIRGGFSSGNCPNGMCSPMMGGFSSGGCANGQCGQMSQTFAMPQQYIQQAPQYTQLQYRSVPSVQPTYQQALPQQEAKASSGSSSGWYKVNPLRTVPDTGSWMLTDVESQLSAHDDNIYKDPDVVTYAHEATHGVNSRVRNKLNGPIRDGVVPLNVFYVGKGDAMALHEPNFTKEQVGQSVPSSLRGPSFNQYLTESNLGDREFSDRALWILDEWVAYTNGAITGKHLNQERMRGSLDSAFELEGYVGALMGTVENLNPSYQDKAKLKQFVEWNTERLMRLARTVGYTPSNLSLLKENYGNRIASLNPVAPYVPVNNDGGVIYYAQQH